MAATGLDRLMELGLGDGEVAGKRALAQGYAQLALLTGRPYPEADVARLRSRARDSFLQAAAQMPARPIRTWGWRASTSTRYPNPELAANEFANAARLGYALGPRETEQQADAYRLRAERRWAAAPRATRAQAAALRNAARQDALRARSLYAEIRGFDLADARHRSLDDIAQTRVAPRSRRSTRRWR